MQRETHILKKASNSDTPCQGLLQRNLSLQRSITLAKQVSPPENADAKSTFFLWLSVWLWLAAKFCALFFDQSQQSCPGCPWLVSLEIPENHPWRFYVICEPPAWDHPGCYSEIAGSVKTVPIWLHNSIEHSSFFQHLTWPPNTVICMLWWSNFQACCQEFSSHVNCCRAAKPLLTVQGVNSHYLDIYQLAITQKHSENNLQLDDVSTCSPHSLSESLTKIVVVLFLILFIMALQIKLFLENYIFVHYKICLGYNMDLFCNYFCPNAFTWFENT